MALIPEQTLEDIRSRLDIAEVIGGYVPLKRIGRHCKALCPFHQEKTPSFMVHADKQIFHCFGCGAGGNVFTFVMRQERLEFPEAVRLLAQRVGVTIPADAAPDAAAANAKTQELFRVNDVAAQYFQQRLESTEGAPVRAYLAKRGLQEACWRTFGVGYAPDQWEGLLHQARQAGASTDLLASAGLILRGTTGQWRDRFHQRLIFPICDVRHRIVGFGGRALDRSEPKYLNSPESPIYTKGRHLYGLHAAKEAIQRQGYAIIVEGYVDCVALHQQGFTQTVSPLGTALTPEQARLLKRYTQDVVMAFDADTAGAAAVIRDMDECLEAGLTVRVLQLPAGQDPDEYVLREGAEAFGRLVQEAATLFDYKLRWLGGQHKLQTLEGRVTAAQAMLTTLVRIENAILRQGYVHRLAEALELDERSLTAELHKGASRAARASGARPLPSATPKRTAAEGSRTERLLVAAMLSDGTAAQRIAQELDVATIREPHLRQVAVAAADAAARGETVSPADWVSRLGGELGALVTELVTWAEPFLGPPSVIEECLRRVQQDHLKTRRLARAQQLRAAQTRHDNDREVDTLLHEYQALLRGGA